MLSLRKIKINPKPRPFDSDVKMKAPFRQDSLTGRLTRGIAIKEFLKIKWPRVLQHRTDLLIALADDTLLHVDVQTAHDRHIAYRMLEYRALIHRRFPRPLRQVVLFVGKGAAPVPDGILEDGLSFWYDVTDLRPAERRTRTANQGDLAAAAMPGCRRIGRR
jgi:hypothetical protein